MSKLKACITCSGGGSSQIHPNGTSDALKEKMKVPKDVKEIMNTENRMMNNILEKWNYDYQGTDMVKDTKRIRKQTILDLVDKDEDPYEVLGNGAM